MLVILTYILLAVCGTVWGAREYFHKDAQVFEKLCKVQPWSFFGSLGWTRKYKFYPVDKRPRNWLISVFPYNDFWHLAWYICFSCLVAAVLISGHIEAKWYWRIGVIYTTHVFHAGLIFRVIQNRVKKT